METKPTVVLTNRAFPETRSFLSRYAEVVANDDEAPWPRHVVLEQCRSADAVMAFMTDRIDGAFLAGCPRLKIVGAALKGYDNIDVEAATECGVWITIVPDLLTAPTAELAIRLMLAVGRNIVRGDRQIRERGFMGWRPSLYGAGLDGATVGLVGFGRVGQAVARRLAGFDCRLVAWDADSAALNAAASSGVEAMGFDDLLAIADFVVLALPLTSSTCQIIGAQALSRMKPGAFLVNPARGSLVDEAAVADALETGRLSGYGADVFQCEDWAQVDHPDAIEPRLLADTSPTVLTPHIGSAVVEVRKAIELSAATSIVEVLQGRPPRCAINMPVASR